MTQIIALTALPALGLSEAPVNEPVHGRGACGFILLTCLSRTVGLSGVNE